MVRYIFVIAFIFVGASAKAEQNANDLLYQLFGLRFAATDVERPGADPLSVSYVSDVLPGGLAEQSGIVAGHVLHPVSTNNIPDLQPLKPVRGTIEQRNDMHAQTFLDTIASRYSFTFRMEPVDAVISAATSTQRRSLISGMAAMEAAANDPQLTILFPIPFVRQHTGLILDQDGLVTEVLQPSPASLAGIEAGDSAVIPGSNLQALYTQMERYLTSVITGNRNPYNFRRDGQMYEVRFPQLAIGGDLDIPDALPARFEAALNELRPVLRPIFEALYRGDFDQVAVLEQEYNNAIMNSVSVNLFGGNPIPGRDRFERALVDNRLRDLTAQYIMIKTNRVGLCEAPAATMTFTRERYETVINGFGVIVSSGLVSAETGSFEVPARFASIVDASDATRVNTAHAGSLRAFISAAGGCESEELNQLENNLLAYQR